jgi:Cu-processing system permease protein
MKPTIRFVVLVALRDRLFVSLYALLAAMVGISAYVGDTALFEAAETTAVVAAGAVRVILALGLTVFVAITLERIYESREIEVVLSRSMSRSTLIGALAVGFGLVGLVLVLPVGLIVAVFAPSAIGSVVWTASLVGEVLILVSFAIFAGISLERAMPTIFATLGFYALSRLMSLFIGIATTGKQSGANAVANPVIDAIALVVPRLDLFVQSQWLIYEPDLTMIVWLMLAQTIVYVCLLLGAAAFDLHRKQF